MSTQEYIHRSPRRLRSQNGAGPSAAFLFGLSRGLYLPPRQAFHRGRKTSGPLAKPLPKLALPEPAKRPTGLWNALARVLWRPSEDA